MALLPPLRQLFPCVAAGFAAEHGGGSPLDIYSHTHDFHPDRGAGRLGHEKKPVCGYELSLLLGNAKCPALGAVLEALPVVKALRHLYWQRRPDYYLRIVDYGIRVIPPGSPESHPFQTAPIEFDPLLHPMCFEDLQPVVFGVVAVTNFTDRAGCRVVFGPPGFPSGVALTLDAGESFVWAGDVWCKTQSHVLEHAVPAVEVYFRMHWCPVAHAACLFDDGFCYWTNRKVASVWKQRRTVDWSASGECRIRRHQQSVLRFFPRADAAPRRSTIVAAPPSSPFHPFHPHSPHRRCVAMGSLPPQP